MYWVQLLWKGICIYLTSVFYLGSFSWYFKNINLRLYLGKTETICIESSLEQILILLFVFAFKPMYDIDNRNYLIVSRTFP